MDAIERAAKRLIDRGYLKYVPEAHRASIREELIDTLRRGHLDSAWDEYAVSRDRRGYPADSEELAEGRMGECLLRMKDVLQAEGVSLRSVEDDVDEQHHDLIVDGERYAIRDPAVQAGGSSWGVATKRFLEIVCELLKRAGSKERLYGVYGGNDGRVILLTEEMYGLLHSSDLEIDPKWMPYKSDAICEDGSMEG